MPRPRLEIADIFRAHGPAWRRANAGHVSLTQLRVMSAIEACRTEALGGHVAACAKCGHRHVAYNSCKNRHCPKCQGPAARDWMAARADDLLPVEYFHVVFTLPTEIARIAYWNKKAVYGLLAGATRKATIARIRGLLVKTPAEQETQETAETVPLTLREPCPCCGGPMHIVEIFRRGQKPMSRAPPREQAA
nr:transposase zinc-binding domain-containing protein [Leisingera aquimarina]